MEAVIGKILGDLGTFQQNLGGLEQIMIVILLILFCLILTVVAIRLMWEEHRERKERKRQEVFTGNEYRPTVTDTVQVIDGVEYHRMGVREGGDKYDNQPHV